jgi:cytochrome P450 family 628
MLLSFDNMGKMGFSKDFRTTQAGTENRMLTLLEISFGSIAKLGQLTWPVAIAKQLDLSAEQRDFENLASGLANEREATGNADMEDIMKYFLEDYHSEKPKSFFNKDILHSDAQAIMIGGTDTIAAALAYIFHYVAKDESLQARLRDEVAPAFGKTLAGKFVHADVINLPLLNAVINETLRMHSPACNNGARTIQDEGIIVDGRHVPGGTSVFIGIHASHRSE